MIEWGQIKHPSPTQIRRTLKTRKNSLWLNLIVDKRGFCVFAWLIKIEYLNCATGTQIKSLSWVQARRSWFYICPWPTSSTALLAFLWLWPLSTMAISRKQLLKVWNWKLLQDFCILVQILSTCSEPDRIRRLPHLGYHRTHHLRWLCLARVLQTRCWAADCYHCLCSHLAPFSCHYQPYGLWLWSFRAQFREIWLGQSMGKMSGFPSGGDRISRKLRL